MRQFAFQFTGQEALLLERAYEFGREVGDTEGFVPLTVSRGTLFSLAIKHIPDIKISEWVRDIDPDDRNTDFSFKYPSSKYRISPEVTDEDYTALRIFAASKMVNLTTAATWVLRNLGGLIFENPKILNESHDLEEKKKARKSSGLTRDMKSINIRLPEEQLKWYAMQAVKRDMSTAQFVRSTLSKLYEKNVNKE